MENSWGDDSGEKGFYTMNDNWYDEHMFEIASQGNTSQKRWLMDWKTEPIVLDAWDPMGSLA